MSQGLEKAKVEKVNNGLSFAVDATEENSLIKAERLREIYEKKRAEILARFSSYRVDLSDDILEV